MLSLTYKEMSHLTKVLANDYSPAASSLLFRMKDQINRVPHDAIPSLFYNERGVADLSKDIEYVNESELVRSINKSWQNDSLKSIVVLVDSERHAEIAMIALMNFLPVKLASTTQRELVLTDGLTIYIRTPAQREQHRGRKYDLGLVLSL